MNWWLVFSLVASVAVLLLDLWRHQKKNGEPWLGRNPKATLALYIPLGLAGGWIFLYKGIPAFYVGVVAFVSLYNDPRAPLLWLLPGLFAMLASMAVWRYGVKAYRRHKSVRVKLPNSAPSWNLWMAIALWAIAFAILVLAFYLRFRLVPR